MRCSCLGRASLLALLLLLVLVLSAMRGVAGSWAATPLAVVDWDALQGGLRETAAAVLSALGEAVAGLLGAVWQALAAIPWRAAIGAITGFATALAAGFAALVGDLVGGVLGFAADLGRGLAHWAGDAWAGLLGQFRPLVQRPSGEGLDPLRLALVGGGWLLVLILVAWFAFRLIGGWLRDAWRQLQHRCGGCRQRTSAQT